MRTLFSYALLVLMSLLAFSCDDDTVVPNNCDEETIVNDNKYNNGPDDPVFIQAADIDTDCLNITFSAAGCSGDSWEVALYASSGVDESLPVQRAVRLSLDNPELCEAAITKTISFDLHAIQLDSENQISLNLLDWDGQLLYEY